MQKQKICNFFNTIVSFPCQLIFIITTSIFLIYIGYLAIIRHSAFEVKPQLLIITPTILREWNSTPNIVTTGLYIENWVEFDLTINRFVFDGIIWFEFDPKLVLIDDIEKFSFENAKILENKKAHSKFIKNLLHVEYEIRVQFNTKLINTLFPFDDHTIFITLTNKQLIPQQAIFNSNKSNFIISDNASLVEWVILDRQTESGYSKGFLNEQQDKKSVLESPRAIFSILVRRISTREMFALFLPLFLLFFIGLLGFGFHPSQEGAIRGMAASSIASIIGYRFVMEHMSPHVGYYMLSDHMFSLVLSLTMIMFIASLIISQYKEEFPTLIIIRGSLFLIFHIGLLLAWYYLLLIWV